MESAAPVEFDSPPAGETAPAAPREKEGASPARRATTQRFDFRHPVFLSSAEWRKVRMEVQEFVESAAALLSTWLRIDVTLQLAKLDTTLFNEFSSALPTPTHATLFKLEPLRGVSICNVQSGLALAAVDRLLGGPGKPGTSDRNLTEMETALMDQFVQMLLDEWCKPWSQFQDLRPEILGHENNPRFLQSSGGDTVMFNIAIDARLGDSEGLIQLAFPYNMLEPLVSKLTRSVQHAPAPSAATQTLPQGPKWNHNLDHVPLTVTARWPSFKVPTRALLALKPGEVLTMPVEGAEQVELRIGAVTKFHGRLGTRDKKWAIQITEIRKS